MVAPVKTAWVKIWDLLVGAVAWDPQRESATFEYHPAFLDTGLDLAPLRMPLPEARAGNRKFTFRTLPRETFHGLPGMLADALPDRFGNSIIDAWLARQGRSADDFSSIERLCYVGKRAMGALEFEPSINPKLDDSTPVEIRELVELAREVVDERNRVHANLTEEPTEALLDIIRVGTSAGGMRPKAVIALNENGDVRSGQVAAPDGYTYWILKFDGVEEDVLGDPKGYGRIEFAYHLMARSAGIDMMECRLLEENGRAHFLTLRFDRTVSGERLHLQSLCALEHFDFNSPGTYAYEQAFETIRRLRLPATSTIQLFRRMVFNVVARNRDDHTKNIAFLMDPDGVWCLAPAFDVIYAHNPAGPWTRRHQMTINGKTESLTREDLVKVGREASIKTCHEVVDEVVESVRRWPEFARRAMVPENRIKEIARNHVLV